MRKILIPVLFTFVLISSLRAESADDLTAKQNFVNRQTFFNKVTDSFATYGKSNIEKASILKERSESRRLARLKKVTQQGSAQVQAEKKKRKKIDAQIKKRARQKNS